MCVCVCVFVFVFVLVFVSVAVSVFVFVLFSFVCELVTIEDSVFVGHGVMTINDLYPPSQKNTGSKELWRPTIIKKGAVIGSNATLFPVSIGENALVGAGAVVTKDVPPGVVVVGNPARIIKESDDS